ncbi:MAG TPA: hypothetical protein VJQ44_02710 [Gemmatimonadales bacterium]|nr:hypothetical protein [Gemmatimonadales bacterium]
MAPRPRLLALLLLLGCGHSEPFTNPDTGTDQPFDAGPPVRLTANRGGDLEPAWLADGSGTLYSVSDPARQDRDVCLALIPALGNRQSELWCDVPEGLNRSDAVHAAGPGPDGRLAFLASATSPTNAVPEHLGIRVAPTVDPGAGVEVRRLPYPRGAGQVNWAGRIHWLEGDRLAYLGQRLLVTQDCANFVCAPPETTVTSLGVEQLDLEPKTVEAVPGTVNATGLATLADGAVVLYTLPGDSRIFRRNLSTGEVTVAHDFGAAGIARDLDAAGSRVVAVVGGLIGQTTVPILGTIQWDSGGVLHLVDLDDNSDAPLPNAGLLYRRPALSPAGDLIIAEGYRFSVTTVDPGTGGIIQDTSIVSSSDLYRFGSP